MRRWLGLGVGVLLLCAAPAAANDVQPLPDLEAWMASYYRQPTPDDVPRALRAADAAGLLADEREQTALTGFLAAVFRAHPELLEGWVAPYRGRAGLRRLYEALWRANSAESRAALTDLSDEVLGDRSRIRLLLRRPPKPIESFEIRGAADLDLLWGSFLASGLPAPVLRVIELLPLAKSGDSAQQQIGVAARAWLESKLREHERVREIVGAHAAVADEATRALLTEILATTGSAPESAGQPPGR